MRAGLALSAALALAGCVSVPDAAGIPAGAHYVAMGSSYAAGAGIGPLKQGTPPRCGRTALNYASLLAANLNLDLDDQSCGGATTAHLLGNWDELPAQVDAVTPDTRLVTITVGGNDLNYMGLLFTAGCDPVTGIMRDGVRTDCPARVHLPEPSAYAALERDLTRVVQTIRSRAPAATVVFVQYTSLVPETGDCAAISVDATARVEARELAAGLAAATRRAADATGASVLPVEQMSADHTACDAQPWSRGFPPGYDGSQGAPWHPTLEGHAAIAQALVAMLAPVLP